MKKVIINFVLIIVITTSAVGCFSRPEIPSQNPPAPLGPLSSIQESQRVEGSFPTTCGTNSGTVHFQTYTPQNWNGQLFATLLNGSPGTTFLSQTLQTIIALLAVQPDNDEDFVRALRAQPDPYLGLLAGLLAQGYRVLEIKYARSPAHDMEGFYSLCFHQGLANVQQHNGDLYTHIITRLGYDPAQSQHRLSAFGVSLGGIQLTHMAHVLGQRFEKVGIAGVLAGHSQQGCRDGLRGARNGMAWSDFLHFALAIALPNQRCREYDATTNFDNFPARLRWDLGLFEGERQDYTRAGQTPLGYVFSIPGLVRQAEYIRDTRLEPSTVSTVATGTTTMIASRDATTLHAYPGCGHIVLGCPQAPTALNDILAYFHPARIGLDHEQVGPDSRTQEETEEAAETEATRTQREREERRQRVLDAAIQRAEATARRGILVTE